MDYSLEVIYQLVGKEDKTANVEFIPNSESHEKFGNDIGVLFLYTQKEREELDGLLAKGESFHSGFIKAKYLGRKLNEELVEELETKGINSEDIAQIMFFREPTHNSFHSIQKRKINKVIVPMSPLPNGGDLDWIYGFYKKLKQEGTIFSPEEELYHLATKYYYEPDQITAYESAMIFNDEGNFMSEFKWHFYGIKMERKEITEPEKIELAKLLQKRKTERRDKLNKYLVDAGSSFKKLYKENPDKAFELFCKTLYFRERTLNLKGKIPIYIDLDSYLHIYMRHVEEMQVTDHFEDKNNFQWNEEDVLTVMKKVVEDLNDEIQQFFGENPQKRYSRYGEQSIYFEGDYYTLHIEPIGRISTFHKNEKKHEK